jgi:hypothetical protein
MDVFRSADAQKAAVLGVALTNGRGQNDKLICLAIDVKNRACGLVGYDVAFTRRRSGVRISAGPSFLFAIGYVKAVQSGFLRCEDYGEKQAQQG